MDLGLPGGPMPRPQPAPVMDDVAPATPIDAPQDDFDQAIAAADEVESSVDDFYRGGLTALSTATTDSRRRKHRHNGWSAARASRC